MDHAFALEDGGARYEEGLTRHTGHRAAPITFDSAGRLIDVGSIRAGGSLVGARFHMGPGTAVDTVHVGTVEEQLTGQAWFIEGRTMTLVEQPDVYDGGVLVARYRWPPHVHLGHLPWVTGSALYGTTRDELDVERVG